MLEAFSIEDDLSDQSSMAIEVTLVLSGGERRWCYFITPEALAACGDWLSGTQIRIHYVNRHMIVVAAVLTYELIEKVLMEIDVARGAVAVLACVFVAIGIGTQPSLICRGARSGKNLQISATAASQPPAR